MLYCNSIKHKPITYSLQSFNTNKYSRLHVTIFKVLMKKDLSTVLLLYQPLPQTQASG